MTSLCLSIQFSQHNSTGTESGNGGQFKRKIVVKKIRLVFQFGFIHSFKNFGFYKLQSNKSLKCNYVNNYIINFVTLWRPMLWFCDAFAIFKSLYTISQTTGSFKSNKSQKYRTTDKQDKSRPCPSVQQLDG